MAPSSRAKSSHGKIATVSPASTTKIVQNQIKFGRVTKARSSSGAFAKLDAVKNEKKEDILVDFLSTSRIQQEEKKDDLKSDVVDIKTQNVLLENESVSPCTTESNRPVKRKRNPGGDCASDSEVEEAPKAKVRRPATPRKIKAVKQTQLRFHQLPLTPASTADEEEEEWNDTTLQPVSKSPKKVRFQDEVSVTPGKELPDSLMESISMHAAFLKAMSLHFAHNGIATPAELESLLESTTRLWKVRRVTKEDLRRLFGLYEVAKDVSTLSTKPSLTHNHGPFRLVCSGYGNSTRTNIEYNCDTEKENQGSLIQEKTRQSRFEQIVRSVFDGLHDQASSFVFGSFANFPAVDVIVGTQTQVRKEKAAATRTEILRLSSQAQARSQPDFSKLSISDPADDVAPSVKSRTLSLFDRVRAKGLAASGNSAPTSEQILRRHAVGRISEVVEFLRMKQQRKLGSQFTSDIDDSPGMVRGNKVSFSLNAIVAEIKQSMSIPLSEEECRMCIRMLAKDIPGSWLSIFEVGTVQSITLQGSGTGGVEVRRMLEKAGSV